MLPLPRALLLDFGGVLADAPRHPPAPPALVARIAALVSDVGLSAEVPEERIVHDLVAGAAAYGRWRDDVGKHGAPLELSHVEVLTRFVAAEWPAAASAAIAREATPLAYAWTWRDEWEVRPGIPEALRVAAEAGLPMAVVSNTLCGAAHRDFLAAAGLEGRFGAQFYSDEAGVRKPNPELALMAARALDAPIGECWFVGDSRDRDIAAARAAGCAAAILMRSPRTDREAPDPAPDALIEDGHGLFDLLRTALG